MTTTNLFIETDGYMELAGAGTELSVMMARLGNMLQHPVKPDNYILCKKWVRASRVEEVSYEENEILLKNEQPLPRVLVEVPEPEIRPVIQPEIRYAPAGYWFKSESIRYHVKNRQDAENLINEKEGTSVSKAIHRLADEIAFNPGGRETLNIQRHFEALLGPTLSVESLK